MIKSILIFAGLLLLATAQAEDSSFTQDIPIINVENIMNNVFEQPQITEHQENSADEIILADPLPSIQISKQEVQTSNSTTVTPTPNQWHSTPAMPPNTEAEDNSTNYLPSPPVYVDENGNQMPFPKGHPNHPHPNSDQKHGKHHQNKEWVSDHEYHWPQNESDINCTISQKIMNHQNREQNMKSTIESKDISGGIDIYLLLTVVGISFKLLVMLLCLKVCRRTRRVQQQVQPVMPATIPQFPQQFAVAMPPMVQHMAHAAQQINRVVPAPQIYSMVNSNGQTQYIIGVPVALPHHAQQQQQQQQLQAQQQQLLAPQGINAFVVPQVQQNQAQQQQQQQQQQQPQQQEVEMTETQSMRKSRYPALPNNVGANTNNNNRNEINLDQQLSKQVIVMGVPHQYYKQ